MVLPALILPLSLLVDRITGDPASRYHPVALLGRFIGWWGRPDQYAPRIQRTAGVLMWLVTAALFALPFSLFSLYAPWYVYLVIGPFLLKVCLGWRSLEEHTNAVVKALAEGVEAGRKKVALLVSRDTSQLSGEQILSAGYESMTENLTDSIVSPLFFFTLFGLTGSAVFRAANTMDAMLGYRDERERIGWFPARMDDILNYIPARVTVALLLLYFAAKGRAGAAWQMMRRDGKNRPGFQWRDCHGGNGWRGRYPVRKTRRLYHRRRSAEPCGGGKRDSERRPCGYDSLRNFCSRYTIFIVSLSHILSI
jgi:adenosylcobinamide-phosphate synthase